MSDFWKVYCIDLYKDQFLFLRLVYRSWDAVTCEVNYSWIIWIKRRTDASQINVQEFEHWLNLYDENNV